MIALISRLENLEKQAFGGTNFGNSSTNGNSFKHTVEEWRMKCDGDRKVVGGKEYFWCPHHRLEGVFDGLYMQHKPGCGHDEWQERKDRMKQASQDALVDSQSMLPTLIQEASNLFLIRKCLELSKNLSLIMASLNFRQIFISANTFRKTKGPKVHTTLLL